MPDFCTVGQKAIVTILPSKKQIVIDENTPIKVTCTDRDKLPTSSGRFEVGWSYTYNPEFSPFAGSSFYDDEIFGEIRGFRFLYEQFNEQYWNYAIQCYSQGTSRGAGGYAWRNLRATEIFTGPNYVLSWRIRYIIKFGGTVEKENIIRIANSKGVVIHEEPNECSYYVTCDGNCPSSYCEIKTADFPGYCCLDVETINKDIAYMRSRLSGVKDG